MMNLTSRAHQNVVKSSFLVLNQIVYYCTKQLFQGGKLRKTNYRNMRLKIIIALVAAGTLLSFSSHAQNTAKITSSNTAYLEYLPKGYSGNSDLYPVVIFLHGIGERGTTSNDPATLKSSALKVERVGLAKNVKYGQQYPFILISPQLKGSYGTWPASYVMDVLNHVKKTLRIDPKRIYITGLSLGGFGTWTTLGANPGVFAAALPICAGGNALSKACAIASENVPVWGFHGDKDGIVSYTVTTKMVNAINACTPKPSPLAKATIFSGMGHSIWDKVYNETNALDWMLGFRNGTTTTTTTESTSSDVPKVTAGSDKTITLPTNSLYIQGGATDSDGIGSYVWTKVSGGTASLSGRYTSKLKAYNLVAGVYVFRLTAKDKLGNASSDDVVVTVNKSGTTTTTTTTTTSSTTNAAPVANAGSNRSITLPTTSVRISGSAKDSDGTIASYKWTQYNGPSTASISNGTTASPTFSGLRAGTYYFKLTVKDNDGATDSDNMLVKVLN